jgi:two-component system CheB/CheR fusion protein
MIDDPSPAQPAQTATERRRVLLIEDNIDAADTLKEALEFCELDVQVAYDGPAGLRRAREFRPEIVLCDIGLPGMDGYEVARAMRDDPALRSTYLIALTGYALPEDQRRAQEAGFDRHLAKPPDLDTLESLLKGPSGSRCRVW